MQPSALSRLCAMAGCSARTRRIGSRTLARRCALFTVILLIVTLLILKLLPQPPSAEEEKFTGVTKLRKFSQYRLCSDYVASAEMEFPSGHSLFSTVFAVTDSHDGTGFIVYNTAHWRTPNKLQIGSAGDAFGAVRAVVTGRTTSGGGLSGEDFRRSCHTGGSKHGTGGHTAPYWQFAELNCSLTKMDEVKTIEMDMDVTSDMKEQLGAGSWLRGSVYTIHIEVQLCKSKLWSTATKTRQKQMTMGVCVAPLYINTASVDKTVKMMQKWMHKTVTASNGSTRVWATGLQQPQLYEIFGGHENTSPFNEYSDW
jgi:hypothetical protein